MTAARKLRALPTQYRDPERVVLRVALGDVSPEARLYLDIDTTVQAPMVRAFLRHIDGVRELLASGRVSPDEAHGMLIDTLWARGLTAARDVANGMRALRQKRRRANG